MQVDQVWAQLLGPLGTLVLALIVIWALVTEKVVPRGRLSDAQALTKETQDLLDKALAGVDGVAKATEERNRLEAARIEMRRQEAGSAGSSRLSGDLTRAEDQIRRPRTTK